MMIRITRAWLAAAFLAALGPGGPPMMMAQGASSVNSHAAVLERLYGLQEKIRDIHPAFEALYPVAIVENNRFFVYVPDVGKRTYRLTMEAPDDFHVPVGVRAAMPLGFWENRIACVVTPEVFDEPGGYAIIFHEFIHCYQWETCEGRLKDLLGIYKEAMERKDFMWELEYPFPYGDPGFVRDYGEFLGALEAGDGKCTSAVRKALKERLSRNDWEYMTWQQWKEGTARFLENEVKARLGLAANKGGLEPPFTRVSFYASGELLIRQLDKRNPGLAGNIETLYHRIAD
jgi:hypothetical protein